MEFGRIEPDQLLNIDFALPHDPQQTESVLKAFERSGDTEIHIGCTRWGHKTWLGNLFPKVIKDDTFLPEYVKHFDCVEAKNTFYVAAVPYQISAWEAQTKTNPKFKFFPLMPQSVSHIRRLKNAEKITEEHISSLAAFGEKLGPSLLQLGENFSPKSISDLESYLSMLPPDFHLFVELRNKAWFTLEHLAQVTKIFMDKRIGFAITDTPGRRDVIHMQLTIPHAWVRFSASGNGFIDKRRLDLWCEKIDSWKSTGLKSIGFFISSPEPRHEPELCLYLKRLLGAN